MDQLTRMTIGDKILQLLERRGWSVTELARRTGILQQQISRWTQNDPTRRPYGDQVKKIADVLGTTTDYLLTEAEVEPPVPISDLERVFLQEARQVGIEAAYNWHRKLVRPARDRGTVGRDLLDEPIGENGSIETDRLP